MMLRTTISRIKKVCSVAFVPRLLRGEPRFAPAGKFEIFSYAVLRKAPKSTKSTDEGENAKKKEVDDDDDYFFISREEPKVEDKTRTDEDPTLGDETQENIKPLVLPREPLKETHYEKCQRIIDQAFGKDDMMEPMLGEQYFSHNVNIEETRRKINESEKERLAAEMNLDKPITDDRTQFGVFKMSRELFKDESSLEPDESTIEATPERGGAKTREDLGLVQQTLNIHLTSAKEPDLTNKVENLQGSVDDALHKETTATDEVDTYIHNQERLENKEYFDLRDVKNSMLHDDADEISELVKDERREDYRNVVLSGPDDDSSPTDEVGLNLNSNTTCIPTATNENVEMYIQNQEKFQKILDCYMPDSQQRKNILHATTTTENEEQLTQKVEHIDETPLVEAQKPNIEGFNVTPRVLGDLNPACSCFSGKQTDTHLTSKPAKLHMPAKFDEVAKRCLDSPVGKIDEILLNEMEKLGIPVTCKTETQARSPVIEDDLVQMEKLHKQIKGNTDKQVDLEGREYEKGAVVLCSIEKLYATRQMTYETILPEHARESDKLAFESAQDKNETELKHFLHPNQVFIYPYDKMTISCDMEENNSTENFDPAKKSSYNYIPTQVKEALKAEITATPPLDNPKTKEINNLINSLASIRGTMSKVITPSEYPKIQEVTSNHITAKTQLHDPDIVKTTSHLRSELTPLDAPVLLGNSKSPTNPILGDELEQALELKKDEEMAEKPDEVISQTPSFDPPRLNALGNIWHEQQGKPDHSYAPRTYARGMDKPSYYQAMNASNNLRNEQSPLKSEYRYPQKAHAKGTDNPPSYYQRMNASNNIWTQHQSQAKPEDMYAQRTYPQRNYTKGIDKASPNYPMNLSNKVWHEQNYQHQPGFKYGHNIYGTGADQPNLYYSRNMSAAYMWSHNHAAADSKTKHMHQTYAKGTDEVFGQPPKYQAEDTKADHVNFKPTQTTYANTPYKNSSQNKFCVPDGTWDKKSMLNPTVDKMTGPLTLNRTNANVSDDIWDEHLDSTDISAKPMESTIVNLPEEILNQQLDPHCVLTCNETCPISPRPLVSACETSRFVGTTETIFEKDIRDAEPIIDREDSGLLIESDKSPITKEQSKEANMQNYTKFKSTAILDALNSLPNLSENVSLSELLRRVRERSRIIECRNELKALGLEVEPAQAKCPRKAPRCPPTAPRSPPNNPVPPPSFGLPQLKPRPRACKPKKPRSTKCSTCDLDMSSGLHLGPKINARTPEICPEMVCEMNDSGTGVCAIRPRAELTEDVIDRLQSLGKILGAVLRQGKSHVVDVGSLGRNRRGSKTLLARDYEPWAPIPSWPTPKRAERKKPQCTPGCKIIPPPRACVTPDPPCDLKPCEGFPKRTFSLLDCFAVSLGENKVYDLGEFCICSSCQFW